MHTTADPVNSDQEQQVATAPPRLDWNLLSSAALVFAAACVMFFYNSNAFPLLNPDESFFAESAREMGDIGEYTTTYVNYSVHYTKPPLTMWAIAACYRAFGVNEFAARFYIATCASLLVLATYLFLRKHGGKRPAWIAAAVLLTSPLFIGVGRMSITDMPLAFFIAASLMSLYHGFAEQTGRWRWLGYILMGLAVLTKGPVGLVIPVAVLVAYHLLRGDIIAACKYYKPIFGLLLTAAVAVPWFVIEIAKTNGGYYQQFILHENVQRFTRVVDDHGNPWYYHIVCMLGGMFPWSTLLPFACVELIRSIHLRLQPLSAVPRQIRDWARANPVLLFSGLTWSFVLAFFSVSVSKLVPYTLPGFAAAAMFIGLYIDKLFKESRHKSIAILLSGLCLAFAIGAIVSPRIMLKFRDFTPELAALIPVALWSLSAIAAVSLAVLRLRKSAASIAIFATLTFAALIGFGTKTLAIAVDQLETPVRDYARFAAGSDYPIVVSGMRKLSAAFYAQRQILQLTNNNDLQQTLASLPHAYVICKTKGNESLNGHGFRLVAGTAHLKLIRWDRPGAEAGTVNAPAR